MANEVFKEKFRLRVSDYDCHDHLLISAILDLCQDVAGKHADLLGVGFDDFISKDKIWMILRTQIEVIKYPPLYSNVLVTTWPHKPNRVDMDRDYLITSEDEKEVYVKVCQKWVSVSFSTRMLLRAKDIVFNLDFFKEERLFKEEFPKLQFDDENREYETVFTHSSFLDLDHNGHINNIKYFNFIVNSINSLQGRKIKKMQIDYIHELSKDTPIEIRYFIDEDTFYVKGFSNSRESFSAKIIVV